MVAAGALTLLLHGVLVWRMTRHLLAPGPPSVPGHARFLWQVGTLIDAGAAEPSLIGIGVPPGVDAISGALPALIALSSRWMSLDPDRLLTLCMAAGHAIALPALALACGRLAGLQRGALWLLTGTWSLVWFTDSAFRWGWELNAAGYAFSAPWVVVGALSVWLSHRERSSRWPRLLGAVSGVVVGVLSPAMIWPLCALAAVRAWGPRPRTWAALASLAPGLVAASAITWMSMPAVLTPATSTGPSTLILDLFDLMGPGSTAVGATRTAVRTAIIAVGVFQLARWRARRDDRVAPVGSIAAYGFLLTYSPAGIEAFEGPLLSAVLAMAVPAAAAVSDAFRQGGRAAVTPNGRIVLAFAALLAVPRLFRTVAYYDPALLPDKTLRFPNDPYESPLVGLNEPLPGAPAAPSPRDVAAAASWIAAFAPTGAVATDEPALAFALARRRIRALLMCRIGARWCPPESLGPADQKAASLRSKDVALLAVRFPEWLESPPADASARGNASGFAMFTTGADHQ